MKLTSIISLLIISQACFGQTVFNKMADFRKISSPYAPTVLLLGYYQINDGASGNFVWIDTSTKSDNGGTVIKPNEVEGAGRYERLIDGSQINVLWFGAKRNGSADASAAILSAINTSASYSTTWSLPTVGHSRVIIPSGIYQCDNTILIKTTVSLEGEGAGSFPYMEVQLRFKGNTSGIVILADTHNGGARAVSLKNLYLRNFGAATDSNTHGIFSNTYINVENVAVDNFGGNGFAIITNDSGNANNSRFINITAYYCAKSGFFCSGNESNNMAIYSSNFSANGMCGVLDRSFLGNMYFGCHTSSNGLRAATGYSKSWCTYGGKVYQSIFYTNQKGIEPTVTANWKNYWLPMPTVFSTVSPAAWSTDSVYWITGSYVVAGPAGTCSFYGCYSEAGQGANNMNQFSMCWGGDHGAAFVSPNNIYLNPSASQIQFRGAGLQINDADSINTFTGLHNTFGFQVGSKKSGHSIVQWKYFENDRTAKLFTDNSTGNQAYSVIGKGFNPATLGLATLPRTGGILYAYYQGFWLGNAVNGAQARNFSASTSVPTTGAHAAGDFVLYIGTDSTIIGYRCVTSGTPGIFKTLKAAN